MNLIETLLAGNHDSGRAGQAITSIVLHTTVGSLAGSLGRFRNNAAQVSSNYMIDLNGDVYRLVREADTAWCNGRYSGFGGNLTSISIEHVDNGDYNGARTPELYAASAELVASICRRYGVPCDRAHIRLHKEVIDTTRYPGGTACPDSLDVDGIIAKANAILNPAVNPTATPSATVNVVTPSATGETLVLPPDPTWRVYPLDKLPYVGNEKGMIRPGDYKEGPNGAPGLMYAVLGHPYPNVVTIQTGTYGIVNIWVRADTGAVILPASAPAPISPAVQPATVDKAPTTAKSKYERLEKPLQLEYGKNPTNVYNLDAGSWATLNKAVIAQKPEGAEFVAVGKATHPLGGVYFMTEYSFGQADVTGVPAHNQGVNTVDLRPKTVVPQPQLQVNDSTAAPAIAAPEVAIAPVKPAETPAATPATDAGETVPVKVIPVSPDAWKTTFKTNSKGRYEADETITIGDLANANSPKKQLVSGQVVNVAGKFTGPDGQKYYRTEKSVERGDFYGIPESALVEQQLLDPDFIKETRRLAGNVTSKEKMIFAAASHEASDIFKRFKKRK